MLLQCRIGLQMAYKLKVMKTKDSYDLEVSNIFSTIVKKRDSGKESPFEREINS